MTNEITIPPLGESVTEATVATFLKPDGASVQEGEEIIELETEKVNQVLYAPCTGVLSWSVKEGDTVKIEDVIGKVEEKGATKAPSSEVKPPPKKETPPPPPVKKEAPKKESPKAEPEEKEEVVVLQRGRESRKKMSKVRKVIAQRLVESLRSSAMLTTFNEVDMSVVMEARNKFQLPFTQKYGVKLGFTSFFIVAATRALHSFPDLNSYIDGEEIVFREYCDIGVAVGGAKGGLVVPVVRDCDKKSFPEIERELSTLASKAREGKLTMDEITGGGFTITNGGVYGSLLSTPILNPPQTGILGLHKTEKRAVVMEDQIVIRPMMYLALSYDHRVIDGKEAVTFLVRLKEVMEDPNHWNEKSLGIA